MSIPAPERRAKADARRARASRTREAAPSRHFMALAAIGSAKPSTPQAWRDAVTEWADGEALRADARATALSIARALAWASERGTLIVRRLTWDRLAGIARCSRRTVARWLSRMHAAGLLARVAPGRSGSDVTAPDSAVYALAVPCVVDADDTPSHPPVRDRNPSHAHARGDAHDLAPQAALAGSRRRRTDAPSWPLHDVPRTRRDELHAAEEMRRRSFALRRESARALRSVVRRFFRAGWTVADVLGAIDTRPDGSRWEHSGADGVRSIRRWIAHRLRAWIDPRNGEPVTAPSAARAQRRAELIAQTEAERREREERRATLADPDMQRRIAEIRATMRRSRDAERRIPAHSSR